MSFIGDMQSFPSMPSLSGVGYGAYEQALALQEVYCACGGDLVEAAGRLRLPYQRAVHLRSVWNCSHELRRLIRVHAIGITPASLMAQLDRVAPGVALATAHKYVAGTLGTKEMEEFLAMFLAYGTPEQRRRRRNNGRPPVPGGNPRNGRCGPGTKTGT